MDGRGGEGVGGHLEGLLIHLLHGQASVLGKQLRRENIRRPQKTNGCSEKAQVALGLLQELFRKLPVTMFGNRKTRCFQKEAGP